MDIHGIGRAIVDYYVEGRIDDRFMEEAFRTIPDRLLPSHKGRPLHVEEAAFSFVLDRIAAMDHYTLIRNAGGTCVNILKTIAQLDRQSTCFFSGTVGTGKDAEQADEDGVFFQQTLQRLSITSKLRLATGATGRCLVLPNDPSCQSQHNSAFLAVASPSVAPQITPEQVQSAAPAQALTLVEGMELEKEWFCQKLLSLNAPLIIACGTPHGAQQTAAFLKSWIQGRKAKEPEGAAPQERNGAAGFPLLIFANDAEARVLERDGINLLQWSSEKTAAFAITHGCGGSSCYFQGNRLVAATYPVPEQDIVDTTGAGDVFAGAFLSRLAGDFLAHTLSPEKIQAAMEYASMAASKIIQVPLCQTACLQSR